MSGAFTLPGSTATPIAVKITTTSPTIVAGDANYAIRVFWLNVAEIAGGTGTLAVDVYDGTTQFFLRHTAAMTANGVYFFEAGIWLNKGQFLRVTTGTANTADVLGLASLPNVQS